MIDSMLQELGLVNKESGILNDLVIGNHALIDDTKTAVQQSNLAKVNTKMNVQ